LLGDHIQKALRYVERNPVRAGLVDTPWQYVWSSARAHVGVKYRIITLSDINDQIGIFSWKDYIAQHDQKDDLNNIRVGTIQEKAFGPIEMIKEIENESGNKLTVRKRGRPFKEN
jgi:putative transposase